MWSILCNSQFISTFFPVEAPNKRLGCLIDDHLPLVQVLDINAVIYGLIYLFYEPNPEDPLNHEAAELYRENISQFERTVKRTLAGCMLQGEVFQRLI